jgi:hypothetical protein
VESLFSRVTRYPRSPRLDPGENQLTEVTAAVFERLDGIARRSALALLQAAVAQAERKASAEAEPEQWVAEANRLLHAVQAVETLGPDARLRIQTQVPTPKGRFVDMEVWLRPERAASTLDEVVVWVEAKYGSDIHGDQLDAYLADINAHPAPHRIVLLLLPRGQTLKTKPPEQVHVVDWQTVSEVVADAGLRAQLPEGQRWLLDEYADYLNEEGLMDPDALSATHALALMEAGAAEDAIAGVCEHADAYVRKHWGKPTEYLTPARSASKDPAFGSGYYASFAAQPPSKNWRDGSFEWGNDNPENWQYLDQDAVRGSNTFYAGATFAAKSNPHKVEENEAWVATLLSKGFIWCWFSGYYRLVRAKYPDELLVATRLEGQGEELGRWVVQTFELLKDNPPPY